MNTASPMAVDLVDDLEDKARDFEEHHGMVRLSEYHAARDALLAFIAGLESQVAQYDAEHYNRQQDT